MRAWMLLLLGLAGCAGPERECGNHFLLLWPNAEHSQFSFQEIGIDSLNSPYSVSGPAAKVYYEAAITASGFEGEPVSPRLVESDGVCVPEDVHSGTALSLYAQMERLRAFDGSIGAAGQIPWPRSMGIQTRISDGSSFGHNNAHYISRGDATAFVPYSLAGLPLALNHGIVAHEHFHAHFEHVVLRPLNLPSEKITNARGNSEVVALNALVIRGWNEGLADFYAASYTGNPRFLAGSLDESVWSRDLTGPMMPLKSSAELFDEAHKPGIGLQDLVAQSYAQGTLIARLLYRLVEQDGFMLSQNRLALIMGNLRNVPIQLGSAMSLRGVDYDEILPVILKDWPLNDGTCALLRGVISKKTLLRSGGMGCEP